MSDARKPSEKLKCPECGDTENIVRMDQPGDNFNGGEPVREGESFWACNTCGNAWEPSHD